MFFNSLEYGAFLVLILLLYPRLSHRGQNLFLLTASYAFYSFWDVRFTSLLLFTTVVDYIAGRWIYHASMTGIERAKKVGLWVSLASNLTVLGFFKYFNFFIDSAESLLASLGLPAHGPSLSIILPVGISFYTFQSISYTVDVYRGKLKPVRSLSDFALYVSFFPQLVAGPIERATTLLPQFQSKRVVTPRQWGEGLYLILIGLVRKVVIADTAGIIADEYFSDPRSYSSLQLGIGLVLYSLQIYGDFAGYSDIARGSARLLGIDLMRNFNHPYFAQDPSDFWRRWHISLSTWLRDYLYIPLGGNRKGKERTYINLITTMVLGGLWHGASWNFVIWGFLHGMYLAVHRMVGGLSVVAGPRWAWSGGSMLVMFALVTFTWLFFRLTDLASIQAYLSGLTNFSLRGLMDVPPLLVLVGLTLCIDIPQALTRDEFGLLRSREIPRAALASAAVMMILFSIGGDDVPFIYFQF